MAEYGGINTPGWLLPNTECCCDNKHVGCVGVFPARRRVGVQQTGVGVVGEHKRRDDARAIFMFHRNGLLDCGRDAPVGHTTALWRPPRSAWVGENGTVGTSCAGGIGARSGCSRMVSGSVRECVARPLLLCVHVAVAVRAKSVGGMLVLSKRVQNWFASWCV